MNFDRCLFRVDIEHSLSLFFSIAIRAAFDGKLGRMRFIYYPGSIFTIASAGTPSCCAGHIRMAPNSATKWNLGGPARCSCHLVPREPCLCPLAVHCGCCWRQSSCRNRCDKRWHCSWRRLTTRQLYANGDSLNSIETRSSSLAFVCKSTVTFGKHFLSHQLSKAKLYF